MDVLVGDANCYIKGLLVGKQSVLHCKDVLLTKCPDKAFPDIEPARLSLDVWLDLDFDIVQDFNTIIKRCLKHRHHFELLRFLERTQHLRELSLPERHCALLLGRPDIRG